MIPVSDEVSTTAALRGVPGGILARGLGRSYGDAATLQDGAVLAATGLGRLGPVDLQGDSATIDAGGGVSLATIVRATAPLGWLPPVLPGTRHVTVGGAIAADVHGKNHHRDGSFGGGVRSFQLVTADGKLRHVDRDRDRALFEATLGGMGLTGVVTSARLALTPLPTPYLRVQAQQTHDLDETMRRLVEGDADHRYSVAWLDLATPGRRGRGIVQHGDLATPDDLRDLGGASQQRRTIPAIPAPPLPGRGAVRPTTVQAFNTLYWRMPRRSPALISLHSFFHPLDVIDQWPRLYGRYGLHQYQFVVPDGAEDTLQRMAAQFMEGPVTPALVVLKRMGAAGEGMLSFPMTGWTLAVDLPAYEPAIRRVLDGMDEAVAAAGGRVYLAKDARLRPELLTAMYPRLEEWRAVKADVDPEHRFRSDLAERLGLVRPRGVR